jgi:two-component system, cell cycle sensor histidine kinase DivJ
LSFKAYLQSWRSRFAPDKGPPKVGFGVLVWHLVWAAFVLIAMIFSLFSHANGAVTIGLLAMAVPGISAIALTRFDTPILRRGLLGLWAVMSLICVCLTGALQSPLIIWLIMPLLCAVALNQRSLISVGAAMAFLTSVITAFIGFGLIPIATAPPPPGHMERYLALMALFSAVVMLSTALMPALRARVARAEDAEGTGERLLKYLTEQPYLVLSLEPDGQITGAFGEAPEGLHRAELISLGIIKSAHLPDRPRLMDAITTALTDGRAEVGFHPQARLDHYWHLSLRCTEDGHLFATLRDATLTHAREQSLEAARSEAEGLNQSKSQFLANMSHELRTPLNAVIGFSDIMRLKLFGPLSDKYSEYAGLIWESGQHVLDLINDVLDMSKIEAQKYELSLENFDAREAVSQALSLVRVQAHDAHIELKTLMPPEPLMVEADKRALKQICLNLLSNALKFTPAAGTVTLIIEPYDTRNIEIIIADTGVGIAPDDLSRLGKPYEQSGSAEQKAMGTGLGLSLVRALANLHQGHMSLESTLGVGTSVRVILPVRYEAEEEEDAVWPEEGNDLPPGDALIDRERIPPGIDGTGDFTLQSTGGAGQ